MGLKNLIKGQLLSSISYRSSDPTELAAVYDRDGRRIMYQSVLTVMPGQAAILVNEGQLTDIFMPGRYELTTNNMPITTTLNQWKYGFNDTFIVDIIFVNTNEIIDIPWGTSEQVTVKDAVFGLVNVGANGKYSLSVTDPKLFAENLLGVKNRYTVADLKSFMTPQIAMYFKEIVTEKQMDFFDMQSYCYEAAQILKAKSDDFFGRYGIQMQKMAVQVALPEVVKKAIDERASLGALGGMDAYAYKRQVDAQADAMVAMAKNPNGGMNSMAGMGMQMSAGMAFGGMMAGNMANMNGGMSRNGMAANTNVNGAVQQNTGDSLITCPKCGASVKKGTKFCSECGASMLIQKKKCLKCGADIDTSVKFCPECGADQSQKICPKCGHAAAPGTKFCPECGTNLG
ncbi:MAG: SPFH domain-containing protein [Coprococcus sp.]